MPAFSAVRKKLIEAPILEPDEIEQLPVFTGPVSIHCVDYSPENFIVQEIADLDVFLNDHRPDWSAVRWIDVAGLSDRQAIYDLAAKYNLHPLAIEDVLEQSPPPKNRTIWG